MSLWLNTSLEDEIDFLTSAEHVSPFSKHVLIYYVTGNPGYIEYYRNYLKFLTSDLSRQDESLPSSSHQTQYHIHGRSLSGFEQDSLRSQPYSLNEIKAELIKSIELKAAEIIHTHDLKQVRLPVILIGHSIGTWLSLEAITASTTSAKVHFQGALLLFPTIIDIAKSPNARRAAWLLHIPHGELIVASIAKLLFILVPLFVLTALLQFILGMEQHSALVTANFLKSRHGVRQALHMARHEFIQVAEDKWSDSLWGVPPADLSAKEAKALAKDAAASSAKLYFFWGVDDHWVANETRDEIIMKRARTGSNTSRPYMEIDTAGLGHAFAVTDAGAQTVAHKTATWVREIIDHAA